MRASRSSISNLLALVALIAVGCAALRSASAYWALGLLGLEYGLLVTSLLAAYFRKGKERAGWLGFGLFGWAFILLSVGPLALGDYGATYANGNGPDQDEGRPILTPLEMARQGLELLTLNGPPVPHAAGEALQIRWRGLFYPAKVLEAAGYQIKIRYQSDAQGTYDEWVGPDRIKTEALGYYHCIGNSLAVLVAGCVGSAIARFLASDTSWIPRPERQAAHGGAAVERT